MTPPAPEQLGFETASWMRRFVALLVDWLASTLVVIAIVGYDSYSDTGSRTSTLVLLVYVVESAAFTFLLGGSFGKLATGLRVLPADGSVRMINPLKMLLRQVLVALVIPPLVFKPDGRGLHDLAAGTATVPADVFRARIKKAL